MALSSLSIILPVYNEEKLLPQCLASLQQAMHVARERYPACRLEPLVVDGGSDDRSREIAEAAGFRVLQSPARGRGTQLAAGIDASTAECVLMLHSDSEIESEGLLPLIALEDSVVWGILGHRYTESGLRFAWVRLSNSIRFELLGIAFGDQGIFVRRETLIAAGGMPGFKLMEDVELSLRLRRCGRRRALSGPLCVSTRRWQRKGSLRYTLQVLSLVARYLVLRSVGVNLEQLTGRMYQEYYG